MEGIFNLKQLQTFNDDFLLLLLPSDFTFYCLNLNLVRLEEKEKV